jgi:ATP-dependent DNA helicase RecG
VTKFTQEQIKMLVKKGESSTLEFKKSTAQLQAAFQTVCAFLNNDGGVILIGVTDNGRIIGQEVADRTKREIAEEQIRIEPPIQLSIEYVSVEENKQVIVINVLSGIHVPYTYDGRPYQRDQSVTRKMSQQLYDQLILKRNQLNYAWEKFIAHDYRLEWLDENMILRVVRNAIEFQRLPEIAARQETIQILERLELLKDGYVTNAAVVLFGTKFLPDFTQCQLKLARFKGINRHEFLDKDLVYGNIFELLERGMHFVKRNLPVAARVEAGKLERVETPIVPFDAIREALINSLSHRNYNDRGGSVGLAIYDDRMEIFNDGGLLLGVTVAQIKKGFSKLRNPLIADVLYRCNLIEKWGRGIQEMIHSCQDAGDPEPDFFTDELEFTVQFQFPHNISPSVEFITPDVKLTKRQQEILTILQKAGELSLSEIAVDITDKPSDRMLRKDMNHLKELGLVGAKGITRGTIWFISNK